MDLERGAERVVDGSNLSLDGLCLGVPLLSCRWVATPTRNVRVIGLVGHCLRTGWVSRSWS
jgi:hypothetical protein